MVPRPIQLDYFMCTTLPTSRGLNSMTTTWIGLAWSVVALCGVSALYEEKLLVRPLSHKVLSHFDFTLEETIDVEAPESAVESLFPQIIDQILTKYDAQSLHLSFAVGRYDHEQYGPGEDLALGPFGARLQVALQRSTESGDATNGPVLTHEMDQWKRITAELGALFSASLNQMDETATVAIQEPISPQQVGAPSAPSSSLLTLQAVLPREELCTENLTPWLKMLPCRSKAGLGQLVDPIKLLSGDYFAISFLASRTAAGKKSLRQRLTSVQRLDSAQLTTGWSLGEVLLEQQEPKKTTVLNACPFAAKSTIATEIDTQHSSLVLQADTTSSLSTKSIGEFYNNELAIVDLTKHHVKHDAKWLSYTSPVPIRARGRPTTYHQSVSAHRFLTGHGQLKGGVATRIENHYPNCALRIAYFDTLPWFLRVYFNTLQAKLNDQMLVEPLTMLEKVSFAPAEPRGSPNTLFFEIVLPPNSTLMLSVQFDRVFVRLSEHPPDANRGFDVASATVRMEEAVCDAGAKQASSSVDLRQTIYTEPLLVALPTPDFSMPFNVIMMTSTVLAFFTGSMLNTLLRKAPRIKKLLSK